ncbi:alanine--tRNA ligase-related protein [Micromonospora sp. KLBMP9576]|uniref:alanine--tRNA ligase-related protein n=1 Tax=Micromonospora sp. KLBMP9576 TaxID=3424769 RepID=UPI003D8B17AA
MFVWTGDGPPRGTPGTDGGWMELWNHVGMRYHRHPDGRLSPLGQPNVDTGMGLERLEMVLGGHRTVFEGEALAPWVGGGRDVWGLRDAPLRLVADHLRAAVVVVGDGVRPSNTGRGYVLRRLLRRALTALWRDDDSRTLSDLPTGVVRHTLDGFGQPDTVDEVCDVLSTEQRRFRELLRRGRPVVARRRSRGPLSDEDYRDLHDTHGLPRDLVDGLLAEAG